MTRLRFPHLKSLTLLTALLQFALAHAASNNGAVVPAGDRPRPDAPPALTESSSISTGSAYEVWTNLVKSALTQEPMQATAVGSNKPITFGGEKEGQDEV